MYDNGATTAAGANKESVVAPDADRPRRAPEQG